MAAAYEAVIGLEVHARIRTATKLFCSCAARYGGPPNSRTCPVCLGMPGTLPVLNGRAVELAVRAALAAGCTVNRRSVFARKHYFYPDLPKGYQITQYDQPLAVDGRIPIEEEAGPTAIGVARIHIEEDAGKMIHEGMPDSERCSYVDFNRCGAPLLEIVGRPEIRGGEQAHRYLTRLRSILLHLGVCDGNMEEGSLRCDANVSVRRAGSAALGARTEIKNLNSFRNVQRALDHEIHRQGAILESGGEVGQETRLWNAEEGRTEPLRSKEESMDYRYFPEPDIPPLVLEEGWIEEIRRGIPELPHAKKARYARDHGLAERDADLLSEDPDLASYYERAASRSGSPRASAAWILTELAGRLNEAKIRIGEAPVPPEALGDLVRMVEAGEISGKIGKAVLEEIFARGGSPDAIVRAKGLLPIRDEGSLGAIIDAVLAGSPAQIAEYRSGRTTALNWLIGQVMKASHGRADPALVHRILREKIG